MDNCICGMEEDVNIEAFRRFLIYLFRRTCHFIMQFIFQKKLLPYNNPPPPHTHTFEIDTPFIWSNLIYLYPKKLCATFGRCWPSGSGEKDEMWTDRRINRRWEKLPWAKRLLIEINSLKNSKYGRPNTLRRCKVAMSFEGFLKYFIK